MRLRFRAGLLRLDAREVIEYRPSLTTGEVAEAIVSPAFDARRRGLRRDRLRRPAGGRGGRGGEPRGLAARAERGAMSRSRCPRAARRRAGLAVLAVLVGVNVVGALIDALAPSPSGPASSSFATKPEGLAAWAELAERNGVRVRALRDAARRRARSARAGRSR